MFFSFTLRSKTQKNSLFALIWSVTMSEYYFFVMARKNSIIFYQSKPNWIIGNRFSDKVVLNFSHIQPTGKTGNCRALPIFKIKNSAKSTLKSIDNFAFKKCSERQLKLDWLFWNHHLLSEQVLSFPSFSRNNLKKAMGSIWLYAFLF